MKKRIKQDKKNDFLLSVIGIVSYSKETQVIWNINKFTGMSFSGIKDFEKNTQNNLAESPQLFSMFYYTDEENKFFLISNKNTESYLIPKFKSFDYFMVFAGKKEQFINDLVSEISKSKYINGAYILPEDNLFKKYFLQLFEE